MRYGLERILQACRRYVQTHSELRYVKLLKGHGRAFGNISRRANVGMCSKQLGLYKNSTLCSTLLAGMYHPSRCISTLTFMVIEHASKLAYKSASRLSQSLRSIAA